MTGLEPPSLEGVTPRDTRLPAIKNKVHTVLGMRRVGKTTFMQQVQHAPTSTCITERCLPPFSSHLSPLWSLCARSSL